MGIAVRQGMKLHSAVCNTQIMVLRMPGGELEITCGGVSMVASESADKAIISAEFAQPTLVGKRYVDDAETMEFLCTRGGDGALAVGGVRLAVKQAKKLPSSD